MPPLIVMVDRNRSLPSIAWRHSN